MPAAALAKPLPGTAAARTWIRKTLPAVSARPMAAMASAVAPSPLRASGHAAPSATEANPSKTPAWPTSGMLPQFLAVKAPAAAITSTAPTASSRLATVRGDISAPRAAGQAVNAPALGGAVRRAISSASVSYTHLRAHETRHDLVCRLLLE